MPSLHAALPPEFSKDDGVRVAVGPIGCVMVGVAVGVLVRVAVAVSVGVCVGVLADVAVGVCDGVGVWGRVAVAV